VTLVDTNVLLDLVTDDASWAGWSIDQLKAASLQGPLLINDVIYAELGVRYERIETLDSFIAEAGLELLALPRAALFLAGKVLFHSVREFRRIAFKISRSSHRARQSCVFRMAAAASRDWWRFGW
jgi:hypothetical protein